MAKPLHDRLSQALSSASKADRAIATFMLSEPRTLPFETAASLAEKVGVSEPTVGVSAAPLAMTALRTSKTP
jgi:DNA-binding MurR/RpiR family transcriptional regulator